VDEIRLAPKENLQTQRRSSILTLDAPSHRAAAKRLSVRNQEENYKVKMESFV